MTRIVSGLLLALLALLGAPTVAPVLSRSVVHAEVSEQQLMEQLRKIKDMMADLEARLNARTGQTEPVRREKMMDNLNEIERLLREAGAYRSN
jgi:hypothetical protein